MDALKHEKANDLYREIHLLKSKIQKIEQSTKLRFYSYSGQTACMDNKEITDQIKNYSLLLLKKHLSDLELKYEIL